jgi:flagellar protein FliL
MADKETKHRSSIQHKITLGPVLILLLLLLEICGITAWKILMTESGASPGKTGTNMTAPATVTYPLDSYTLNLEQHSGTSNRSLKLGVLLKMRTHADAALMDEWKPLLNDSVLMLLSEKAYEDLATVKGKLLLKEELLIRMNQILGHGVVQEIYFSEFG